MQHGTEAHRRPNPKRTSQQRRKKPGDTLENAGRRSGAMQPGRAIPHPGLDLFDGLRIVDTQGDLTVQQQANSDPWDAFLERAWTMVFPVSSLPNINVAI